MTNKHNDNVIFHRNNYRALAWVNIFLLSMAIVLLGCTYYVKLTAPMPKYFASTSDGYLIEIHQQQSPQ